MTEFVSSKWTDQVKEKEAAREMLEKEESEYARYLAAEKQKAEDLDIELRQLKLNREVELKEVLKQQMIELKQREAESEVLNREEADLLQERRHVMQLNEQRQQLNEQNARVEHGQYLLRQHKAKLRQRAKEIQEALLMDLQILQHMAETNERQRHVDVEKRVAEREAELDSMFQDEAAKGEIWQTNLFFGGGGCIPDVMSYTQTWKWCLGLVFSFLGV